MSDQINDARQNLRLPQDRKDAYAKDARKLGLTLPEYTRMALAERLARASAKLEARLLAIETRLKELAAKIYKPPADE